LLKKVITYTNPFTEQEVTEEHYFHISKADLVEMEMEENKAAYTNKQGEKLTGMQAKLQQIVDSEDGKAIMAEFKDIIRRAYGKKEGDRFLKSNAIWEDFSASEAFSQLLFEICTDANAAVDFINGVVPKNMEQIAAEVRAQAEAAVESPAIAAVEKVAHDTGAGFPSEEPKPVQPGRILTEAEVVTMNHDELTHGLATGKYKLS
jgi:hypothetical protein